MSMSGGQSLTPYPWAERKKFNDRRRMIRPIVKVTRVLSIIATILSFPSAIAWLWMRFGFRHYNDSWSLRPLIVLGIAAVSTLLFARNPLDVAMAWRDVPFSWGPDSELDPLTTWIKAVLAGLPYALALQSLHGFARTFEVEVTTSAFLKPTKPTTLMRARRRRNIRSLEQGIDKRGGGYARFGVIVGDRIPWRTSRYGMIVERRIEKMGHGVGIGSNGMGKTEFAKTFAHDILTDDAGIAYIDFKASTETRNGVVAIAREAQRPYHIFDVGLNSRDTTWYDLLGWEGTPTDKASVLIDCFQLAEGGGSDHYRAIALAWLPIQIEAMGIVGLRPGEGSFDFLRETVVPAALVQRIEPMRTSPNSEHRELFEQWTTQAHLTQAKDLTGLRSELTKIVNSIGHRLKPNAEHPKPVSLRDVMDHGGMLYIGIAPSTDTVILKVLGSFILKEIGIHVAERSRVADKDSLRDVFVMLDEASRLEERSILLNLLYASSREARIWLWPLFQSFASWDPTTVKEIQNNARNFVAFAVPDPESAEAISKSIPDIWALSQMSEEQTRQQPFQSETVGITGDTRVSVSTDAHLRPNIELTGTPKFHAYIWFKDADTVSRDRWWGRRRVRKDEIVGDAPLVRLVPFRLAISDHDLDELNRPEARAAQEPTPIADPFAVDSTRAAPPTATPGAGRGFAILESEHQAAGAAPQAASPSDDSLVDLSDDWGDDAPPPMPDFYASTRRDQHSDDAPHAPATPGYSTVAPATPATDEIEAPTHALTAPNLIEEAPAEAQQSIESDFADDGIVEPAILSTPTPASPPQEHHVEWVAAATFAAPPVHSTTDTGIQFPEAEVDDFAADTDSATDSWGHPASYAAWKSEEADVEVSIRDEDPLNEDTDAATDDETPRSSPWLLN